MSHDHCHWGYRHGAYVSPWFWPTRQDAEHASGALSIGPGVTVAPEIYPVHADPCTCSIDHPGPSVYEVAYQRGSTHGTSRDQ